MYINDQDNEMKMKEKTVCPSATNAYFLISQADTEYDTDINAMTDFLLKILYKILRVSASEKSA